MRGVLRSGPGPGLGRVAPGLAGALAVLKAVE
jgi:hypothetical protein